MNKQNKPVKMMLGVPVGSGRILLGDKLEE
jgi:hypothetical protein